MYLFSCASCHVACTRGEIFEIAAAGCGSDAIEPVPCEETAQERRHAEDLQRVRAELQGLGEGKQTPRSRRDLSLSRQVTGLEDPSAETPESQATESDAPHVLRRSGAGSRLDLLAPIQEKKVGKRLTLALSRVASKIACTRCLRTSQPLDRDKVLQEVIFESYLSSEGGVEAAWFVEVQHEAPPATPGSVGQTIAALLQEWNLPHEQQDCELDRPLSEYWINSSHNSYLQGNQLTSTSSAMALSGLLRNGCRVVELDVYDGHKYGMQGPCVLHGGTATTAVSFQACLEAIRDAAFETSSCPVVITLENYLSPDGQRQCASLLREVLGDSLYVPPPQMLSWPTPGELLKRFLLRDKSWQIEEASPKSGKSAVVRAARVPELHQLISIGNVKFRSFKESQLWQGCTSSSLSETKLLQLIAKSGLKAMRSYTALHLCRIYPAGYRVDSSNYDPQDAWEAGCQMVALNGQKSIFFHPHAAWLNAGKFRGHGGCGFVPKPGHLLSDAAAAHPRRLVVVVLGGDGWEAFRDFDLLGPPDSYVCVEIAGASADRRLEKTSVYTPRVKTGPKAQPVWKQSFEFVITDMALAVIMLVAWDQDVDFDDLLGQYAFPLTELKPGWRRVPLLSSSGAIQEGKPALICRFEIQ